MTNELAQRVEAASGADRELDAAIARAVGWTQDCSPIWGVGAPHWWLNGRSNREVIGYWEGHDHGTLPFFTTSIDAAMTLVPEGLGGEMLHIILERNYLGQWKADLSDVLGGQGWTCFSATPALAICAAALRARQEKNDGD